MKTLLLMRHAKSDWGTHSGGDHERPLNERGQRAARSMGEWVARTEGPPDLVLSSTAERARDTAERAASAGGWDCPVRLEKRIYGAGPDVLLELLRATDDDVERLLLVGHEPAMSATLARLAGMASVRFPTACVARVDLDVDSWREVAPDCGQLVWLLPPRLLDDDRGA